MNPGKPDNTGGSPGRLAKILKTFIHGLSATGGSARQLADFQPIP
jgi:hypothetical protein